MRDFDPAKHKKYCSIWSRYKSASGWLSTSFFFLIFTVAILVVTQLTPRGHEDGPKAWITTIPILIAIIYFYESASRLKDQADSIQDEFIKDQHFEELNLRERMKGVSDAVNEKELLSMGMQFINNGTIKGGVNINTSQNFINSFNRIKDSDPDIADAIAIIKAKVEQVGDVEARKVLEELVEEIDGDRKPTRVKAFWNLLKDVLPDVAKLAEASETIVKLF